MKAVLLIWALFFAFFPSLAQIEDATTPQDENLSLPFRTRNSLIIVRVVLNDTIKVSLALDAHCKSIVLFGRKFDKMLRNSRVALGAEEASNGPLSFNNTLSIGPVTEDNVSILVMPNTNPLNLFTNVNGIISTEFFSRYNLSFDHHKQVMTFEQGEGRPLGLVVHPTSAMNVLNLQNLTLK